LDKIRVPGKQQQKEVYSLDKLVETTFIDSTRFGEWEDILNDKKQIILFGPPGTDKTFVARVLQVSYNQIWR
jgi:ATP-dependent 26S proteasome regulatory subunit